MSADDDAPREHAQRLLAAYRAEEALPDDVRARVRERLSARPEAPVAGPRARWVIAAAAVAAALAAIWWGRGLMVRDAAEAPSAAVFQHREAAPIEHAGVGATTLAPALPPRLPDASNPAPPTPTPTPAPTPTKRAADRPRSEPSLAPRISRDPLAEEAQLLREAQAALARGDGAGALALLDAGARRFTAGVLIEERAALHVLALCELGRRAPARDEASAFAAAHPRSPLLARVRAACVEDAAP
jgi:hypothetical protein